MSPTFPPNAANFPSPARTSARRATESPAIMMENNGLTSDSNRLLQQSYMRSMSVVQQPSSSSGVESLVQKTQSLAMTTELVGTHSHSLFEVSLSSVISVHTWLMISFDYYDYYRKMLEVRLIISLLMKIRL
jgi:hypothetical protein